MEDENLNKAKKTLVALDEALDAGPWNESTFITMIGKKLRLIREDLSAKIAKQEEGETSSPEYLAHRASISATHKLVYVGLYSVEGINITSWERILANIQRQIVSRPVYMAEEDIQNIIKTKEKKINEAYVSFYVNEIDILQLNPDKVPVDKLGKPMLVLRDNAVQIGNIDYFVHLSGKYRYTQGRLIKLE